MSHALAVFELMSPPDPMEMLRRAAELPYPLLLESGGEVADDSRYTFLCADPRVVITARGRSCDVAWAEGSSARVAADPLVVARDILASWNCDPLADLPPFQGGLAGYVAYEYGQLLERIPDFAEDDLKLPDVVLALYDVVLAWDRLLGKAWLLSTGFPPSGEAVPRDEQRASRAAERLAEFRNLYEGEVVTERSARHSSPAAPPASPPAPQPPPSAITPCVTREEYGSAISRIQEYIRAGDIFQANLTQRFTAPLTESPLSLYARLREASPAPFAAFYDVGDAAIVSSSPERFVKVARDGAVETRPIKGTRPRSADHAQDLQLSAQLAASPKDRAEHVMIVDVLRNDLSRVCRYGSVIVSELLALRHFPAVHHLVSTIRGQLRAGCDAFDLLHAVFPGGSITGAPKIRAMEIIAELEPVRRSVYCGTIGYVGHTGDMDSSIVIRTIIATGNRIYFSAGGGIVADSDADAEYAECFDKVRGITDVLMISADA